VGLKSRRSRKLQLFDRVLKISILYPLNVRKWEFSTAEFAFMNENAPTRSLQIFRQFPTANENLGWRAIALFPHGPWPWSHGLAYSLGLFEPESADGPKLPWRLCSGSLEACLSSYREHTRPPVDTTTTTRLLLQLFYRPITTDHRQMSTHSKKVKGKVRYLL